VKHMTSLIDDLLDVSRVTRGLVTLEKVELDIKRIVADAVEQVRPLMEARHHQFAVHMSPEPTHVLGDQKRLVQVLANLLNNAMKFTPEGGSVVLRMEVSPTHIYLTVEDNGIGMSAETVDRAFDLFSQAEPTSDRTQGGLGIGLALVKTLMELHGGSVIASSAGVGAGSQFKLCFPRTDGMNGIATKESVKAVVPSTGLRLLIVDDNEDAANVLAMLLEATGHTVSVENESKRALERARIEVPDVCLLDIGLPDMDGYELARRLKAQPETMNCRLIAITGYGQESDRQNTAEAGFDHHLVKPIDAYQLTELLRGFV
jgi:CheY-like chemotaxis protein